MSVGLPLRSCKSCDLLRSNLWTNKYRTACWPYNRAQRRSSTKPVRQKSLRLPEHPRHHLARKNTSAPLWRSIMKGGDLASCSSPNSHESSTRKLVSSKITKHPAAFPFYIQHGTHLGDSMVLSRTATLVHLPPASSHAHHHPRDRGVLDLRAAVCLECGAMGRSYTE